MGVRWAPRTSGSSINWTSLSDPNEGVINGSADVLDAVEADLLLVWQLSGAVTSDLTLLWQVDADPITAVESDLTLTWNVITAAGTTVERDLVLLWQRAGSLTRDLTLTWQLQGEPQEARESLLWVVNVAPQGTLTQYAA